MGENRSEGGGGDWCEGGGDEVGNGDGGVGWRMEEENGG